MRRAIRIILIGFGCALVVQPATKSATKPAVLIPPVEYIRRSSVEVSRSLAVPRAIPTTTTTSTTTRKQVTTTSTVKKATTTTTKVTQPAVQAASVGGLPTGLLCIRQHESHDNYQENTGNGFYGAYQYLTSTWNNYGGYSRADYAPASVQDERALSDYNAGAASRHSHWPQTSRICGV